VLQLYPKEVKLVYKEFPLADTGALRRAPICVNFRGEAGVPAARRAAEGA